MPDEKIAASSDALSADLARLRDDVVGLTKAVGALLSSTGTVALEQARETGERLQSRVNETATEAGAAYDHGLGVLTNQITARPLTAILIAFATGLVLGKLADRR